MFTGWLARRAAAAAARELLLQCRVSRAVAVTVRIRQKVSQEILSGRLDVSRRRLQSQDSPRQTCYFRTTLLHAHTHGTPDPPRSGDTAHCAGTHVARTRSTQPNSNTRSLGAYYFTPQRLLVPLPRDGNHRRPLSALSSAFRAIPIPRRLMCTRRRADATPALTAGPSQTRSTGCSRLVGWDTSTPCVVVLTRFHIHSPGVLHFNAPSTHGANTASLRPLVQSLCARALPPPGQPLTLAWELLLVARHARVCLSSPPTLVLSPLPSCSRPWRVRHCHLVPRRCAATSYEVACLAP